jgi:hypothetical protein
VLSYTVNATVGGKLAQIGSRLIDSTAKKMANDFFSKFAEVVGGSAPAAAAPAAEALTPAPAPAAEPGPKKGLPAAVWVIGVIVILALLMWVFQS